MRLLCECQQETQTPVNWNENKGPTTARDAVYRGAKIRHWLTVFNTKTRKGRPPIQMLNAPALVLCLEQVKTTQIAGNAYSFEASAGQLHRRRNYLLAI